MFITRRNGRQLATSLPYQINCSMSDNGKDFVARSTTGVSLLMITQIFTKLSTFLLNQVLIRFITPEVFGVATYLEFILSTILFFSREAVRLSVQRISPPAEGTTKKGQYREGTEAGTIQSIINFSSIPLYIGQIITAIVIYSQYNTEIFSQSLLSFPYSKLSIVVILVLILLELIAEPLYAINQYQLNFAKRSKFEGLAVTFKCLTTFSIVLLSKKFAKLSAIEFEGLAILAFALGQFAYSFTLFANYQLLIYNEILKRPEGEKNSLFFSKIYNDQGYYYFDRQVFKIWKNYFVQMIFKHLLTEGDKILMNYLCTIKEQGVYSVVTNYGSIVARLLFQPIEESLRLLFSKLLTNKSKDNVNRSLEIMQYLMIFYINLSILIALAGYTNAAFLLQFLIGGRLSKWSQSNIFEIFPQYIIYIPFMAFNGILEAFFASSSTEKQINQFSIFMSILTIFIFGLLYYFINGLGLGLTGLILANINNMLLRIVYCSDFIFRFYSQSGIRISFASMIQRIGPDLLIGSVFACLQYWILGYRLQSSSIKDFAKSVVVCFGCLIALMVQERKLLVQPLMIAKSKFPKRKSA